MRFKYLKKNLPTDENIIYYFWSLSPFFHSPPLPTSWAERAHRGAVGSPRRRRRRFVVCGWISSRRIRLGCANQRPSSSLELIPVLLKYYRKLFVVVVVGVKKNYYYDRQIVQGRALYTPVYTENIMSETTGALSPSPLNAYKKKKKRIKEY